MFHLPKKRPWIILVFIYLIICAVWATFIILGSQQGERMTPQEAEEHIRKQQSQQEASTQPES